MDVAKEENSTSTNQNGTDQTKPDEDQHQTLEVINASTDTTSSTKKKKKKKKGKKPASTSTSDVHQEETHIQESPNSNPTEEKDNNEELSEDAKFDMEVKWCIEQLRVGIKNAKSKEQSAESESVIRKLSSAKYPKVGKRHLMHVVFGDYRKRMREQGIKI